MGIKYESRLGEPGGSPSIVSNVARHLAGLPPHTKKSLEQERLAAIVREQDKTRRRVFAKM